MSKLIGTNPNQVPSNADLGTAAFMDKKEFLLSKGSEMSAIDAVIPKTAVDVFIYDTTKDSDGGAWRKRTQHTSWYNEKLNTTTRGSRREFPAVAVIVVTGTQMIIHDADVSNLPMWMVFTRGGGSGNFFDATQPQSISAKNGILYPAGPGGSILINFISEYNAFRNTTRQYNKGNIAERNSGKGWVNISSGASDVFLSSNINDVAMTVLPNAPIDSATGLPVPTIAVATDGGVSVIKDDGSVVDITFSSEGKVGRVAFIGDKIRLGGGSENYIQYAERMYDIPTSDTALGAMYVNDSSALNVYFASSMATTPGFNADMFYNGTTSNKSYAVKNAIGSSTKGLTHLDENFQDATKAMMAYATSDYNTGWMNGDIKLATLSDTDATNVTGAELVTNGTFDSNATGWTASSSSLAVTSGELVMTTSAAYGAVRQYITTVVGKTYTAVATARRGTSDRYLITITGATQVSKTNTSNETNAVTWVATTTSTLIEIAGGATAGTVFVDSFLMRLAEEDRSVNGNGLQVFGTVTKTAVATGADLVSYGGFSRSNYLQQPYNSDLDFGTGDFSIMGWLQASIGNAGERQTILDRGSASLNSIAITREYTGKFVCTAGSTVLYTTGTSYTSGNIHFILVRKSGTLSIYVNGVLDGTVASTTNVTDTDAVMTIGVDRGLSASNWFTRDRLALLRISATAPSAEQIKKMYEDEKVLFQDNAKAVLYGTSDAVTALAYDDDTDLLHVGTSAGRSDFQGLRRINNTTRAIGTAISAVDGFIVEE